MIHLLAQEELVNLSASFWIISAAIIGAFTTALAAGGREKR